MRPTIRKIRASPSIITPSASIVMPETMASSVHRGMETKVKIKPIGNKQTLAKSHPLNAIHYTP